MQSVLLFLVAFFAIVFVVFYLKNNAVGGRSVGLPYAPAKTLFSPAERSFLGALDEAVGADYRVFGKVRVADVATVKKGLAPNASKGALNKIAQKHFDYIVCRASDLSIVAAVELNDKSHASKRAQARDTLLAGVCHAIKLPLLTVPAKASYAPLELRDQLIAVTANSDR